MISGLTCNTSYQFVIWTTRGLQGGSVTQNSLWVRAYATTSACSAVRVGTLTRFGNSAITAPAGLAWDGRNLYMVDDATDALYRVNRTTGRATRVRSSTTQFGASITNPRGLAWDGTSLYMITSTALYTVNKRTGVATRFGTNTFPSNVSSPSGIAWDGQRLFMTDAATDSLYRLDTYHGTARGSATLVGRLRMPTPLPARVVNNPAGLAWVNSTNTLYMGGDNPDAIYTVDRRNFSFTRFKNMGAITDIADIEWAGTTMYAVDDGTDALYTIPGVPSSAPTQTLDKSYLPSEGDLYYNGGNFADAFMKWDNSHWQRTEGCESNPIKCSTYEHDLTLDVAWFVSPTPYDGFADRVIAQLGSGYCSTWSRLPHWYNDCPTAGIPGTIETLEEDMTNIEMSFGSFKANAIVDDHYYYGSWTFGPRQAGALNRTSVTLGGQHGKFDTTRRRFLWWDVGLLCRTVTVNIKCVVGLDEDEYERDLISTNWTYGTAHYAAFRRLR